MSYKKYTCADRCQANNGTADTNMSERILNLLDGLPLAIAQAGAYLQESGVGLKAYLNLYEQEWSELMVDELADAPLQDYPDRSVWMTWATSYQAIRKKHESTANLLLLWSFLDNKDLWYGLLAAACKASTVVARMLSEWIGNVASSQLAFNQAMRLLRSYSLLDEVEEATSYATHPVVHRWAYHSQGKHFASKLGQLAVAVVGWAVPDNSTDDWPAVQRRLLPHAQAVAWWMVHDDDYFHSGEEREAILHATHLLGNLYADQGKLTEAEYMYERALRGYEKALGPNHTSTLQTVNNLGALYAGQGKLVEAENMYQRALHGYEKAWGLEHTSTLDTVNNLGALYADLGRLDEAEHIYKRALRGYEKALGPNHTSTLQTVNNLGALYAGQGKLVEAEHMYQRALQGYDKALGPNHTSKLQTFNNLGLLYADQGKFAEAQMMFELALRGYERALGDELVQQHQPALDTMENMGHLYADQGEYIKARAIYSKALLGFQGLLGQSNNRCRQLASNIEKLLVPQASREEHIQRLAMQEVTSSQEPKEGWKLGVRQRVKKILRQQQ